MRTIGALLLIGGCIGGCGSLAENTTVETGSGGRVHNIGLVSDRQNHLIISGFVALAGVLFFGFGEVAASRKAPSGPRCPHCGGVLESIRARLCQHCGSELRWVDDDPLTPEQFEEHKRAQAQDEKRLQRQMQRAARASAERREAARETGRAVASGAAKVSRSLFSSAVGVGAAFDGAIRKAAGDGNEIIYRFLQIAVYLGVPGAIAAVMIFAHR